MIKIIISHCPLCNNTKGCKVLDDKVHVKCRSCGTEFEDKKLKQKLSGNSYDSSFTIIDGNDVKVEKRVDREYNAMYTKMDAKIQAFRKAGRMKKNS